MSRVTKSWEEPTIRRAKLLAVLLMVWLSFTPMMGVLFLGKGPALLVALLLLPMTTSQSVLTLWHTNAQMINVSNPSPVNLGTQDSHLMYLESANTLSWLGVAAVLYFQNWLYCFPLLGLSCGIMVLAYQRKRLMSLT